MLSTAPQEILPGPHITRRAWRCWNRGWNSHICNLNLSCSEVVSFIILHSHRGLEIENEHNESQDIVLSLLSVMVRP